MNPFLKIGCLFGLCCVLGTAVAQTVQISGRVLGVDSVGLAGVEVLSKGGQVMSKSGIDGSFRVQGMRGAQISFFKQGFHTSTLEMPVEDQVGMWVVLTPLEAMLNEIAVIGESTESIGVERLRSVEGTAIYAGKKNDVILLDAVNANLATNNSRQIYAKVAGLNVWQSDGAGLQLDIGSRGLNPSRSSNFNTRQNGYDISADALGYPESYYTPPTEALEKIEVVKGAASLQYGSQFGGLLNFKLRKGAADKPAEVITRQTIGSFKFGSSFTSIGGTVKKWNYYAFFQVKNGDGWRPNSEFDARTGHANLSYMPNDKLKISLEFTHMNYRAHQPGGLTDAMFEDDPLQSVRERNWFGVNWNVGALNLDYQPSSALSVNVRAFGLKAERNALGYLGLVTRIDPGGERDLIKGKFENYGSEIRVLRHYRILGMHAAWLTGIRLYRGQTRNMQGAADSGEDAVFHYTQPFPLTGSDYTFPSTNIAGFMENLVYVTPSFTITPGIRFEHVETASAGYYTETRRDLAGNILLQRQLYNSSSSARNFLLAGIGIAHKLQQGSETYANISQNYRAINFSDLRLTNPNARVDTNMTDEHGWSADIGNRGQIKGILSYDVSAFYMMYKNRIGDLMRTDTITYIAYRYRTNISDSRSMGIEAYAELNLLRSLNYNGKFHASIFANGAYIDARYINSKESAITGNYVEHAPPLTIKTGATIGYSTLRISAQYSYSDEQFTDATNAIKTPNAVNGIIPAYDVWDLSASWSSRHFKIETGCNNLANKSYFTRRATAYPGPGIIPADGRSLYITLQVKI